MTFITDSEQQSSKCWGASCEGPIQDSQVPLSQQLSRKLRKGSTWNPYMRVCVSQRSAPTGSFGIQHVAGTGPQPQAQGTGSCLQAAWWPQAWGDWGPSSGVTACFAVGGGVEGKPQRDFKDHKPQRALHSLLS